MYLLNILGWIIISIPVLSSKKLNGKINKFLLKINKISDIYIYIFLIISTLSVQAYTLNQEIFNWDTSTFLIVANDIRKFNLPLLNQWDNKNPLLYFFYALPLYFFGNNIFIFKFQNYFVKILLVMSVYTLSKKISKLKYKNIFSAIFFIVLLSRSPYAQSFDSEYVVILFYIPILNILLKDQINRTDLYLIGIFSSLTFLVSSISVFLLLFTNIYFFLVNYKNFKLSFITKYFFGLSIPFIFLIIIYRNYLNLIFSNLFIIPIKYSSQRNPNLIDITIDHFNDFFFFKNYILFGVLTYLILIYIILNIFRLISTKNLFPILLVIFSSLFTYFYLGKGHWHYLIFYYYFLSFAIVYLNSRKFSNLILITLFFSFTTVIPFTFRDMVINFYNIEKISAGYDLLQISNELQSNYEIKEGFALNDHLLLFYLDIPNYSKIVHPSNHWRDSCTETLYKLGMYELNELEKIKNANLDLIICDKKDCVDEKYFLFKSNYKTSGYIYLNNDLLD